MANAGLLVYAIYFVTLGLARLRRKLLWRIRRKLIISYLLIGLVPTVLILSFFVLSGYFTLGQVSAYMLNRAVQDTEMRAQSAASLLLSDLRHAATRSRSSDEAIRKILSTRLNHLGTDFPDPGAIYLEHRRGRIQRVVATSHVGRPPSVGTNLPAWIEDPYRGGVQLADADYASGISGLASSSNSSTVIVLAPLSSVLNMAASGHGFHIDQILTSVPGDTSEQSVFVPRSRAGDDDGTVAGDERGSIRTSLTSRTLPWWTLLPVRSLDDPHAEKPSLVVVQFGFPLGGLYESIGSGALQLGPSGPDLGPILLTAMALLAVLFLVIEVSAIFVGLVLARSITGSVHALSQGTEHVRKGDFNYKVQVHSRDQLGELADSFNLMTSSIEDLLRQSTEKERLEEELRIARSIQMSLLPKDRMEFPGLSISALCLPATEVGGDYYDFFRLDDERLALLIADVSGKGTSAALYMAELKGLLLSLSQTYDSPRELLIEANKILAANLDSRSFITMAYAVIDMSTRRMTYSRAGHNPIFHLPKNGDARKTFVLAPDGLGLALDRGTQFERILREEAIGIASGDLLLFFTDGVSEAMNPRSELFGEARIREIMEENADLEMEELRTKMIDEVFDFAGGAEQHDDMTMVLVKVL